MTNKTNMKADRREFLKLSGMGIVSTAFPSIVTASDIKKKATAPKYSFRLGIASYSFRQFSLDDALKMTKRLNIDNISLKDFHLKLDASDAEIAEAVQKCKNAGIRLYGGGVIYMNTTEEVDRAFEYARKAGMEIIIGVPKHELLPYVEKKVQQFNIKLAIHNHGPGDKNYPSAESAYEKIKDMDSRMGLCIDIGHTARIKRDPSQDIRKYYDRVFDVHIKDVTRADETGSTCEIGRGIIDIPKFLREVIRLQYTGILALEFEKDANDPLPGMAESIGYIKGVLAGLV